MSAGTRPEIDAHRVPPGQFHDLGPRLASGAVLAATALGIAYLGGVAFALLIAAVAAVMCWEWSRIVRHAATDTGTLLHAGAVLAAIALAAVGQLFLGIIVLAIAGIAMLVTCHAREPALSALGVLYVGVPSVLLVMLRGEGSHGFAAVMLVLIVVWAVDIAAFIGGRSIGGPKLWPAVSPNKTWSGFFSGVTAGVLAGVLLAMWIGAPILHAAPVSLLLGAVSQGGDLAESALKREFGVKDSSRLIPGHGGFLDRLDGVVAAATLAGLIGLVANATAPARALLFGA